MNPGCIVRCRNRDWVLLPNDQRDVYLLRPLTGATDEVVAIHKGLSDLVGYEIPSERVQSASFPLPAINDLSDAASAHLLWQAARLTLREGATPLRSLGRISIRPRIYQFVPLLMAMRLDPVRMLIADDVGVGKTIESLLIARELYDRGEIKRICVLCPPYLCDQWQKELTQKFNLEAVVIRSGTVSQLDRKKVGQDSIYQYYPIQVASIDFLKSDRNKHQFLQFCPDFIIVDEAHGAAAAQGDESQQHRHQLLRDISKLPGKHLVLVTATPHSGIETAFRSLLELLKPDFGSGNIADLDEPQRAEVARHFVQRTRKDIETDWEAEHCFPKRDPSDETYSLSAAYRELFARTYGFCYEMVRTGKELDQRRQRVRYWGALALLSCVMSSPAAAEAALSSRKGDMAAGDDEPDLSPQIYEPADELPDDEQPTPAVETAEATLENAAQRQLRELGRLAAKIRNTTADTKLEGCARLVGNILKSGGHPIVWCRYVATAVYVAEGLQDRLSKAYPNLRVIAITGRLGDDERREKIEELGQETRRVLVATDCLSEGINLQEHFNAILHYDLPWNPNRLEQREGRVDRFGQRPDAIIKVIRYFSPDNAVDGIVLRVLLDKAREIYKALGTYVPIPAEGESVTQALLNALFIKGRTGATDQLDLGLDLETSQIKELHKKWDLDAQREKISRTKYAQRALKPDAVRHELEAVDTVLGDPAAVREFVLSASQRLNLHIIQDKKANVFKVTVDPASTQTLPPAIRESLSRPKSGNWYISFTSPTPANAEYLGRNHRFVAALARFLLEEAITKSGAAKASRCGVMRTKAVTRLTTILLLRIRYLVQVPGRAPLLSEEIMVGGYAAEKSDKVEWLTQEQAMTLLAQAQPDANISLPEKRGLTEAALQAWPKLENDLQAQVKIRSAELEKAHKRIRQAVSLRIAELKVEPQMPPDLLGILVLQPQVKA